MVCSSSWHTYFSRTSTSTVRHFDLDCMILCSTFTAFERQELLLYLAWHGCLRIEIRLTNMIAQYFVSSVCLKFGSITNMMVWRHGERSSSLSVSAYRIQHFVIYVLFRHIRFSISSWAQRYQSIAGESVHGLPFEIPTGNGGVTWLAPFYDSTKLIEYRERR